MKVILAVCVLVAAASAAQTFTELLDAIHKSPAFNHLPHSEQLIVVELLAEARLGELQAYIDKVGFARVLSAIDHLPEREAHIVTQALIKELNLENHHTTSGPTAVGKRSLQDVLNAITHSPSYANLTAAEQQTIKEIAHAAESHTLTAYINKVGYATVLKLLDDLSENDTHKLTTYINNSADPPPIMPPTTQGGQFPRQNSATEVTSAHVDIDPEPVPMMYVCATMWHETENEMLQFLTSIFRLDMDQNAKERNQQVFGGYDPEYYRFEAFIFFDDAFEAHEGNDVIFTVNNFVKQLFRMIDKAASKVHERPIAMPPPVKYATPFGGRLRWTLPGGNRLVAHLKDKTKIVNKKRWSQVMYMNYIFSYRLTGIACEDDRPVSAAEHTFLLALDGDVDFKPSAVQTLIQKLMRDSRVGAVCGRIHPIGDGPLIWYQVYEYAIGQWLQKTAEHVMGCVLCTPGCFSVFRASALMDPEVLRTFSSQATVGRDSLRMDQGEDRWLCSLLIEQGYRVEYCATADAQSYSPEGFQELFNQRRRWIPADIAHTIHMLRNWKSIVQINKYITRWFVLYQIVLLTTTILKPATIILLMARAMMAGYPGLGIYVSLFIYTLPFALFTAASFLFEPKIQVWFGVFLIVVYAVIMACTMVGVFFIVFVQGLCSMTGVFLLFLIAFFTVLILLHPKEQTCMVHTPMYFLLLPSTYTIMIGYCIYNLHVMSWGTREVTQKQPPKTQNKAIKETERAMQCEEVISTSAENRRANETNNDIHGDLHSFDFEIDENPSWLTDKGLGGGEIRPIHIEETVFWVGKIKKSLCPKTQSIEVKRGIQRDLTRLRNKMSFLFIMINVIFIVGLLIMEKLINTEGVVMMLPCEAMSDVNILLDPIDLFVVFMYGFPLFIQFFSMICHRVYTFCDVVKATNIVQFPRCLRRKIINIFQNGDIIKRL